MVAPMPLVPGTLIAPNVRLSHLLGVGGMGRIWVADHLTLRIQVAVKFMATEVAEDAQSIARFTREATAAAQIRSPHIVQTFDHGVMPDGTPYIVMELLQGESLGERLDREQTLSLQQTATLVEQIGKALTRAHAVGIVHRDIKPENVFLVRGDDDELFVKVLDFGIAKRTFDDAVGTITSAYIIGTPSYMSPEQLVGERVTPASDLWSLGVVTYQALTGAMPFDAETLGGVCVAIDQARFVPPTQLRPELPAAVDTWMDRALSREANGRFGSAKELAAALAAALAGERAATTEQVHTRIVPLRPSSQAVPPEPRPAPNATLFEITMSASRSTRSARWLSIVALMAMAAACGVGVSLLQRSFASDSASTSRATDAAQAAAPRAARPSVATLKLSVDAAASAEPSPSHSAAVTPAPVRRKASKRSAVTTVEPATNSDEGSAKPTGTGTKKAARDYGF
jgi:serine/threonine-protein kinase